MKYVFHIAALLLFASTSCSTQTTTQTAPNNVVVELPSDLTADFEKVTKSEEEWKKQLSSEEYYILREKGTEPAGTSVLLKNKQQGIYTCAACDLPLFVSTTKFESGTGWPSFYAAISNTHVTTQQDVSYGMVREEILCGRCDGHLGHVFDDGPNPTGLRYCVNGISLDFVPKSDIQDTE